MNPRSQQQVPAAVWKFFLNCFLGFCLGAGGTGLLSAEEGSPVEFSEIQQILKTHCVKCHGPLNIEGELDLSSPAAIFQGGDSGKAVIPGKLIDSPLWTRVADNEMPPETPLDEPTRAKLKKWISTGAQGLPDKITADDLTHWSFRNLKSVSHFHQNITDSPIDQFLQEELKKQDLQLSPEADLETLLRRVSFLLTGLPPTLEERDKFLKDRSPEGYSRIVEHYLNSPHYGERWGKFWLDAAGYADSNGYFNADTDRPLAWRYRDYVVRSFNDDKPFDQFVREQLAGDELSGFVAGQPATPEMIELLEATHFLRNAQDGTDSSDGNPDELRTDRYSALEGTMQIVSSSLLGLTIQCAKCHEHKFEPITHEEYYQFQSFFYPAFNIEDWKKPGERMIYANLSGVVEEWEQKKSELESQIAKFEQEFQTWSKENRPKGEILFADDFSDSNSDLKNRWSATAPGDDAPASPKPIHIGEPDQSPSFYSKNGQLYVETTEAAGYDSYNSTIQSFHWAPDQSGDWIQVSFDLINNHIKEGEPAAARIGYGLSLHDANDNSTIDGGNVIFEGAFPDGGAGVYFDHPGPDSEQLHKIGNQFYHPGHNYGIRITRQPEDQLLLQHLVDGAPEGDELKLTVDQLPPGGFGFLYFRGRSYIIDNVLIERSSSDSAAFTSLWQEFETEQNIRKKKLEEQISTLKQQIGERPGKIAWAADYSGNPPEVHLLERGSHKHPGQIVQPVPFSVLSNEKDTFNVIPPHENTTGRRLAWANWVTQADSRPAALMARVQGNRIWQHYFGKGIVSTTDNLGMSGAPPSHPDLLEYLAALLVEKNWSFKAVHRQILHSDAFKQSSLHREQAYKVDPDNKLYWKFPRQRLSAEAVRDSLLAVSGSLDASLAGPYVPTTRSKSGQTIVPESQPGSKRRSLYLYQRRTQIPDMLQVFDAPKIVFNCTQRNVSTTPLQSLALMNSEFIRNRAAEFTDRLLNDTSETQRIPRLFEIAYNRLPSDSEQTLITQFLQEQQAVYAKQPDALKRAWIDCCQMLMASNEFLYIH